MFLLRQHINHIKINEGSNFKGSLQFYKCFSLVVMNVIEAKFFETIFLLQKFCGKELLQFMTLLFVGINCKSCKGFFP